MKRQNIFVKLSLILLFIFTINIFAKPTYAAYHISFESSVAKIISPSNNNQSYYGSLTIKGTSELNQIWVCVRGPAQEVVTYPVAVVDKYFQYDLFLRFGPGTYTIWVGDTSQYFDGSIRFEVINILNSDTRYSSPSAYLDSNHEVIVELTNSLIKPEMNNHQKLETIYQWATHNINYDFESYLKQNSKLKPASVTIKEKKGVCRDYSFVVAALARAAGLEARVIYGKARNDNQAVFENHAWPEVRINNTWVCLDPTWDAGYMQGQRFISCPQTKFFNIQPSIFQMNHQAEKITLH